MEARLKNHVRTLKDFQTKGANIIIRFETVPQDSPYKDLVRELFEEFTTESSSGPPKDVIFSRVNGYVNPYYISLEDVSSLLSLKDMFKETFKERKQKPDYTDIDVDLIEFSNAAGEVDIIKKALEANKTKKNKTKKLDKLKDLWTALKKIKKIKILYEALKTVKPIDREKIKDEKINITKNELSHIIQTVKGIQDRISNGISNGNNLREMKKELVDADFPTTDMSWEDYKAMDKTELYKHMWLNLLYPTTVENFVVDEDKKKRLLRCLYFAIRVGLNYQELGLMKPVRVKYAVSMTEEDANALNLELKEQDDSDRSGKIMSEEQWNMKKVKVDGKYVLLSELKKVKVEELRKDPYYENIDLNADLGDYISIKALSRSQVLVNATKRKTLRRIFKVSQSYEVNLDKASASDIDVLCGLTTLTLAPSLHAAADCYFRGEVDMMESEYNLWLLSSDAFKLYQGQIEENDKPFIDSAVIPKGKDGDVSAVLQGDFDVLSSLIVDVVPDDHVNDLVKKGALNPVSGSVDVDYSEKLSENLVGLGFMPEGFVQYCGVKLKA